MGFVKEQTILKLVWDQDTKYPGLEVRAVESSTAEYLRVAKLSQRDRLSDEEIESICGMFARRLLSWNLETPDSEGVRPVPATLEGLLSQDFDFISAVIVRWATATSKIDEDLGKDSSSGDRSVEASIPMETLSPNPQSLSMPS